MGKLICAWCGKLLDANYPVQGISHGICPECEAKFQQQVRQDPPKPDPPYIKRR